MPKVIRGHDKNYVEVAVELHFETEKAYLVSDDGETKVWIPKSQIEEDPEDIVIEQEIITFTIPEWLAKDKGLI